MTNAASGLVGGLGQQLAGCEAATWALPTSGRLSVTSPRRPSRQRLVFRHTENPARACDVRVPTAAAKRGFFYDAAFTHTMMSLRHAAPGHTGPLTPQSLGSRSRAPRPRPF